MQVTITDKEYDAIHFAIEQIRDCIEGCDNEEYIEPANEALSNLYSISEKYGNAYSRARELNDTIAMIRKKSPYWISGNDAAKLARQYLKEYHKK